MTYYVESGHCQKKIECGTKIQAALIFLLTFNEVGMILMVSSVPFADRAYDCPKDACFWLTEDLRGEISETQRRPRIVSEEYGLSDSKREMVETVAN